MLNYVTIIFSFRLAVIFGNFLKNLFSNISLFIHFNNVLADFEEKKSSNPKNDPSVFF